MTSGEGRPPSRSRRGSRTFAVAAIAALLFLAVFYRWPGDTTLAGEILTIWPPELWGLVFVCLSAAVFLVDRSGGLAVAGVSVLFLLATSEWATLLRPRAAGDVSAATGPRRFRLVTWNVARNPDLSALEPLKPDVCLFQESAPVGEQAARSPHWTGFHWAATSDPAIFSRYAMEPVGMTASVHWVWAPPQGVVWTLPSGARVFVVNARLMLPGVVRKLASPGDTIDLQAAHASRLDQLRLLAEFVGKVRASLGSIPTVVCGDFNTPARAASVRVLAPLEDVWPSAGRGWGATMGADWPIARIDQCWVSEGIRPLQAWVERGRGSDHRMLIVDFEVR